VFIEKSIGKTFSKIDSSDYKFKDYKQATFISNGESLTISVWK
jgi:hypothetical protein